MLDKIDIKLDINKLISQFGNSIVGSINATIIDIWRYCTLNIHYATEEKRLRLESNLKDFSKQMSEGLNNIPISNFQEPKTSILGPALDASKYYIEEPELRSMFANLIVASADKSLNSKVRTCFTEIIKQLEPIDAYILNTMKNRISFPVVSYTLQTVPYESERTIYLNITEFKMGSDEVRSSLDNLIRLGIFHLTYDEKYSDYDMFYSWASSTPEFIEVKSQESNNQVLKIKPGIVNLTSLGCDFISICLSDNHSQSE